MSASFDGSSIWLSETSTSGGIFLFSLMYCSNCETTVRASASISLSLARLLGDRLGMRLEERLVLLEAADPRALAALDQHLHRAVGQLQQLQHRADGADRDRCPPATGSSCAAFFCVTSRICLSSFITSSSARTDFSRPTKSGTIMCGNTTMSRSGSTG